MQIPCVNEMLVRYAHVNYEVFYDENGVWHFCTQEEDRNCSDRYSLPQTLRPPRAQIATIPLQNVLKINTYAREQP